MDGSLGEGFRDDGRFLELDAEAEMDWGGVGDLVPKECYMG
jgi:hypothetical protein